MLFHTITKIEFQEKKKDRRNIYLDGKFAFGIHEEIYVKFGLTEGGILTPEQVETIQLSENKRSAKETALRFLEHRSRSEKEIRQKLVSIKYPENVIEETVQNLKGSKLIDDEDFARRFAQDKILGSPMGGRLLRQELWKKGIVEELIQQTIREILPEIKELELAEKIVQKKIKTLKNYDDRKKKQKLSEFLARKGFDWEIIRQAVKIELFE
jgi:regulatory protein